MNMSSLELYKELYDTLSRIQSLNKHSDTLINRAFELTKKIEVKYGDLKDDVSELTGYADKVKQKHAVTRNKLDKANTDLVRAYVQIGKAYMRAVEDDEDN